MRDRAAVNGKAMRTLGVLYPNVIDIGCFSHMLDLVGDNFKTPSLWSTGWSFTSIATKQDWFGEKRGGVSGSVKNRLCFCVLGFCESADAAPKSCAKREKLASIKFGELVSRENWQFKFHDLPIASACNANSGCHDNSSIHNSACCSCHFNVLLHCLVKILVKE